APLRPRTFAHRMLMTRSAGGILAGPFAGMKYVSTSVGSVYEPKLMGTYELELHPIIEQLCKQQFSRIIDVGAAEGYYAVGMAMRSPRSEVIAFETTTEGQALIAQLAALNEVAARVE